MERTECPLCKAPRPSSPKGRRLRGDCPSCGLTYLWQWDKLDDLDNEWSGKYYYDATLIADLLSRRAQQERLLLLLERYARAKGRLLDVGAGLGLGVRVANERGWRATGIEPSTAATECARKELGIELTVGTLEAAPLALGLFDALTIVDVLRHVPDPMPFMEDAKARLRRGGAILIRENNLVFSRAYYAHGRGPERDAALGYRGTPYLQWFTRKTLAYALTRAGFETVCVVPGPIHVPPGGGLAGSLRRALTGGFQLAGSLACALSRACITPGLVGLGRRPETD